VNDALFEQRLEAVEAMANEALQEPDAWQGLAQYLHRTLQMQLADRAPGIGCGTRPGGTTV
jgi:hypothetical protein